MRHGRSFVFRNRRPAGTQDLSGADGRRSGHRRTSCHGRPGNWQIHHGPCFCCTAAAHRSVRTVLSLRPRPAGCGMRPMCNSPCPQIGNDQRSGCRLPLGATEDRVAGALDLERALSRGEKVFEPGLLAKAIAVISTLMRSTCSKTTSWTCFSMLPHRREPVRA